MAYDPNNFLDALIAWIAARSGLEYAGTPRQLWKNRADEANEAMVKDADDRPGPYTVIAVGPPTATISSTGNYSCTVYCSTVGEDGDAAWEQSTAIANALLNEDGEPVWRIGPDSDPPLAGWWLLGAVAIKGPYRGSLDSQGRVPVLLSFDAPFEAA